MQIKWTGVCHHTKNYGCYIMGVLQVNTKSLHDFTLKEGFLCMRKGFFALLCFTVYFPVWTFFTLTEH